MANVILYALKSTGCRVNVLAIGSAICHATCSMATCAETRQTHSDITATMGDAMKLL